MKEKKMMKKKIAMRTYDIPTHMSGQIEHLIQQILTLLQKMTPTIEDIERHTWVRKCEVKYLL